MCISDRHKLNKLSSKNGAVNKILADICGCRHGSVKEFGLADSATADDFESRLASLKERWDSLCPEFHGWFTAKRKDLFKEKVIEEARQGSNVNGLYYNNNIESMHFKKKTEQCHKLLSLTDVIGTLRKIVERKQDDEIRALYGNGPYKLSKEYCRFSVDSLKWHSISSEKRKKHVFLFRIHKP